MARSRCTQSARKRPAAEVDKPKRVRVTAVNQDADSMCAGSEVKLLDQVRWLFDKRKVGEWWKRCGKHPSLPPAHEA
eukprot:s125_g8.t1